MSEFMNGNISRDEENDSEIWSVLWMEESKDENSVTGMENDASAPVFYAWMGFIIPECPTHG